MDFYSRTSSPWGKLNSFEDPFVNLSNKKNRHSNLSNEKDHNMDRYIAQSVQKCLFKDKLEFNI